MKCSLRIRSGFTLIEVALAATILLVGFAGMATALIIGSEMLDTARKQTIAAQIIQSEIERLRMLTWTTSSLPPDLDVTTQPAAVSVNSTLSQVAPSSLFTSTRTVQLANGRTDLRQVTITVTWKSITGKIHSRSCTAYIGKYGLNVSYQKQ